MNPTGYNGQRRPIEERLFGSVERLPWSGCWIWMKCLHRKGYGELAGRDGQGKAKAHRLAWEIANGRPVPVGMLVCHSCDIPSCINPAHLWLGTNQQNLADAGRKGRLSARHFNGRKTHCPKGHPYTVENTWLPPSGGRKCRECGRLRYVSELEGEKRDEEITA
jgi:hypothetical protein